MLCIRPTRYEYDQNLKKTSKFQRTPTFYIHLYTLPLLAKTSRCDSTLIAALPLCLICVKSCQFPSILKICRSSMMTAFQCLQGLPSGRVPVASLQESTLFTRQWSGIRHTWPSHLSLDVLTILLMVVMLAWARTSTLVIFCQQRICMMWHKHIWWNISSWCRCVFIYGSPGLVRALSNVHW